MPNAPKKTLSARFRRFRRFELGGAKPENAPVRGISVTGCPKIGDMPEPPENSPNEEPPDENENCAEALEPPTVAKPTTAATIRAFLKARLPNAGIAQS